MEMQGLQPSQPDAELLRRGGGLLDSPPNGEQERQSKQGVTVYFTPCVCARAGGGGKGPPRYK